MNNMHAAWGDAAVELDFFKEYIDFQKFIDQPVNTHLSRDQH